MTKLTFTMELPDDLMERLVSAGPIEWGTIVGKTDDEHVADFIDTLRLTREHFGNEGNTDLNGLYLAGTETVVAHTGTSPNSASHARIIAGLWNALLSVAQEAKAA